ncbi:MAG: tRNA (adenosine(37)-N6)-threonylcarbamoyltransferase complex ATPase subunit type 1 TsaE [Aquificota bacterium]|nr:MAG: tRNA (adenosine(37)-N6)-threonylcarbamoyltransferase complex ATPase subunit type 1 TsaE [Aquificota bacterium]
MKIEINSLKELKEFTTKLIECLKGNEIILLYGNLGAGKTTFTKYLVSSINPELEDEVNSPTFTVMNIYETEKFTIYHIDLYRVKEFDITDIVGTGIIVIEWSEYINLEDIDNPVLRIKIDMKGDKRVLNIDFNDSYYMKECLNNYLKGQSP